MTHSLSNTITWRSDQNDYYIFQKKIQTQSREQTNTIIQNRCHDSMNYRGRWERQFTCYKRSEDIKDPWTASCINLSAPISDIGMGFFCKDIVIFYNKYCIGLSSVEIVSNDTSFSSIILFMISDQGYRETILNSWSLTNFVQDISFLFGRDSRGKRQVMNSWSLKYFLKDMSFLFESFY